MFQYIYPRSSTGSVKGCKGAAVVSELSSKQSPGMHRGSILSNSNMVIKIGFEGNILYSIDPFYKYTRCTCNKNQNLRPRLASILAEIRVRTSSLPSMARQVGHLLEKWIIGLLVIHIHIHLYCLVTSIISNNFRTFCRVGGSTGCNRSRKYALRSPHIWMYVWSKDSDRISWKTRLVWCPSKSKEWQSLYNGMQCTGIVSYRTLEFF